MAVAFWWMPTTSSGRDGFRLRNFSAVFSRAPAIGNSYSRPNSARTAASASRMAERFPGCEKSA